MLKGRKIWAPGVITKKLLKSDNARRTMRCYCSCLRKFATTKYSVRNWRSFERSIHNGINWVVRNLFLSRFFVKSGREEGLSISLKSRTDFRCSVVLLNGGILVEVILLIVHNLGNRTVVISLGLFWTFSRWCLQYLNEYDSFLWVCDLHATYVLYPVQ